MPKDTDRIQQSLLQYCKDQIAEMRLQRMAVARNVGKQRAYLKGEPTDWFDTTVWRYRAFQDSPDYKEDNSPRYNYHVNIFNAAWQVLQSAIQTAGIPGSVFVPQNAKDLRDVETARIAKPIIDYQRTLLNYRSLWMGVFRYFYTDGLCLAYEHHVRDQSRWGTTQAAFTKQNEIPIPAGYMCQNCGTFAPGLEPDSGLNECPSCGAPIDPANFTASSSRTEISIEQRTIPAGRELVDLFGALETILPWWAPTLDKAPFAAIRVEIPPEMVIQTFPALESIINSAEDGVEDYRTRLSRQQAKAPKDAPFYPLYRFPSYGRWWLRPECFYREKDKGLRDEILQEFPDGCFLQEVNFNFCDVWPERMEEHVVLMKAFESDGMYCPSIGQNGVPIQEAVNTAFNLEIEAQEFAGFPPILIDQEILSGEGMKQTKAVPGQYKEITLPAGKSLRESVFQVVVKESSQAVNTILGSYQQWLDFLMGISQALLGGAMTNTRSAEQYETSRNQALQRQAPPYEAAKQGFSRIDELLVNDFLDSRTNEEFAQIVGATSMSMQEEAQRLATARGKVFAYSEEDSSIPQTWAQKRAAISDFLNNQSELIRSSVADPSNLGLITRAIGIPEWNIPGNDQREHTLQVIQMLLSSPSQQGGVDPQTGQQQPPSSSIQFDPLFDDAQITLQVIRDWAVTPEGLAARNSPNFDNLRLYTQAAQNALNPPPPTPQTPGEMAAEAQAGVIEGLTNSQNPDKKGTLGVAVLEGMGILNKKAVQPRIQDTIQ